MLPLASHSLVLNSILLFPLSQASLLSPPSSLSLPRVIPLNPFSILVSIAFHSSFNSIVENGYKLVCTLVCDCIIILGKSAAFSPWFPSLLSPFFTFSSSLFLCNLIACYLYSGMLYPMFVSIPVGKYG